jgi:hypothetical protein
MAIISQNGKIPVLGNCPMVNSHLRRFDGFVLKPLWIALIAAGILFLFQAAWLMAVIMFVLAFFGVGATGAAMHRTAKFHELVSGLPIPDTPITEPRSKPETDNALATALVRVGMILAVAVVSVSVHFGLRWYIASLFGVLALFLGPIAISTPLAIANGRPGRPQS